MNVLTTITDGDELLKLHGTFGHNKQVTINNFGGVTYLHLKTPKKNADGWKSFTLSLVEYRELVRMAGPTQLATIAQNFDIQNSRKRQMEKEALKAASKDPNPQPTREEDRETVAKRQRVVIVDEDDN